MSFVCVDLGVPFPHPEFRPPWPVMATLTSPCVDCSKMLTVNIRRAALIAWIDAGMPLENPEEWFVDARYPEDEDLSPLQSRRPLTKAQLQALHAMKLGGDRVLCGGCAQRRRLAERDLAKAMTAGI